MCVHVCEHAFVTRESKLMLGREADVSVHVWAHTRIEESWAGWGCSWGV